MGCFPNGKKTVLKEKMILKEKHSPEIPHAEKLNGNITTLEKEKNCDLMESNSKHNDEIINLVENNAEKLKIKEKDILFSKDRMIGKQFAKVEENYEIIEKIGQGSIGVIYKVYHVSTGKFRAMKVVSINSVRFQDDDKSFLKEIEVLIKIDHPNIIKLFEYYVDDNYYYIITEYLSGGDLFDFIQKTKIINEETARHIFSQLISAVYYLHSKMVVHRDIKPENILIEYDNNSEEIDRNPSHKKSNLNIKLIDFGSSAIISSNKLTQRIGTPYYIAPEVILRDYNEKCDEWSCGVILYFMLIGYPPFNGKSHDEILKKVGECSIIKKQEWDKISIESKDLIVKILNSSPFDRITAENILKHQWLQSHESKKEKINKISINSIFYNIKNFSEKEKLQQATFAYIIHFLKSSTDFEELKKIFKEIDLNGDGRLAFYELKEIFENIIGTDISEEELMKIISNIDQDKDGYIEYEEFLCSAVDKDIILTDDNIHSVFKIFDGNKDGKLSLNELKHVLGTNDKDYLDIIINQIDLDKDGLISFNEFRKIFK